MTYFVQDWVIKDASSNLRNEQLTTTHPLHPLPSTNFCDLFQGWGTVVFLSMMCMYTETFPLSVMAPNAIMGIYGILFGGIHSAKQTI